VYSVVSVCVCVSLCITSLHYFISVSDDTTAQHSEERCMFTAASVCLFVCQCDNFRTSKRRMLKLGV